MRKKITNVKKRLISVIEQLGISKIEFCKKVGVSYYNMSGKALESELCADSICKILEIYPDISAEWLMRGTGHMWKDGNSAAAIVEIMREKDCKIEELTRLNEQLLMGARPVVEATAETPKAEKVAKASAAVKKTAKKAVAKKAASVKSVKKGAAVKATPKVAPKTAKKGAVKKTATKKNAKK